MAGMPGLPCTWEKTGSLSSFIQPLTIPPQVLLSSLLLSHGLCSQPPPLWCPLAGRGTHTAHGHPQAWGLLAWGHVLRRGWGHPVQRHPSLSLTRKGDPGQNWLFQSPQHSPRRVWPVGRVQGARELEWKEKLSFPLSSN